MGVTSNLFGVTVAAFAVWIGFLVATKEDLLYRVGQAAKAVYSLHHMPKHQIENFLLSYEMFEMDQFIGTPEQMQYVKDYYETLNHLCAIGNYEKMYLPPLIDPSKDTYSNQKLYEKRMAHKLNVKPGSKVLDIGCGRGRIAHLVSTETGADVTGINIDKDQLKSCRSFAAEKNMSDKLHFVEANYNEPLPFPDESFDAVYYVQVIGGYGTDLRKLYKEAYRVLKPGGMAAFEDYIVLPGYNSSDVKQRRLVQASKAILGVANYFTDEEYRQALDGAGFEMVYRQNASVTDQTLLLERDRDFFLPLTSFVTFLNTLGAVPQHFAQMLLRMTQGTHDCIEAQQKKLVTGDIETLVRKPATTRA